MTKKETTIDDLAIMVQKGFDSVHKEIQSEVGGVRKEMNSRFEGVNSRLEGVNSRLDRLERGQEDIKLRLDQAAYRFELQDLEKRVTHLEKKAKFVSGV